MKVYITKYALTKGIFMADAVPCFHISPEMLNCGRIGYVHRRGKEWAETAEEAFGIAAKMRDKKIVSLEKQIAKLKSMTFKVTE